MPNQKYTVLALFFTILIDALSWGMFFSTLPTETLNYKHRDPHKRTFGCFAS